MAGHASGLVGIASPKALVLDARPMAHTNDQEVKDAWFVEAGQHSEAVRGQSYEHTPPGWMDQEQFNRESAVDDEEGICDACEHARHDVFD